MDDNELDGLIEQGFRSYAEAEPPLGLERRVTERVLLAEQRRRVWQFSLAGTLVAAAAGLIAMFIHAPHAGFGAAQTEMLTGVAHVPTSTVAAGRPAAALRPGMQHRKLRRSSASEIGRLSPEERAIIELARAQGQRAVEMQQDLLRESAEPVQIAPVTISNLEITSLNPEGTNP